MKISLIKSFLVSLALLFTITGCAGLDGLGGPSNFGNPYANPPLYNSGWEYERQRQLDRERWEIDRERRRLEDERRRQDMNNSYRPPVQQPRPRAESCPNGYTPSEQKCSSSERKQGCKDMRLPGGLGCVRRSFR